MIKKILMEKIQVYMFNRKNLHILIKSTLIVCLAVIILHEIENIFSLGITFISGATLFHLIAWWFEEIV